MLHCYQYEGIKHDGSKQTGKVIARSEILAAKEMIKNKITIFSIKKISEKKIFLQYKIGSFFKIYTKNDRFILWWIRELSDLLRSGTGIMKAVESTAYKANSEYHKILLYQLHQLLFSGLSFSSATEKVKLLSKSEIFFIDSAEKNGSLLDALAEMHDHMTQHHLSKSRRASIIFPLIFLMIPTVLLSHYIANNILTVYVFDLWMQNKSVPFIGQLFLSTYSGSMTKKILSVLVFILLSKIFLSLFFRKKSKKIQKIKEKLMLSIPIKKSFIKKHYSVYFLSSLSFALKSNLPLHQAFHQAASVMQFNIFKHELFFACQKIYQGFPIKLILKNISFLDPGDRLMLQTSLDSYSLDNNSIHHLLRYTYIQLKNLDTYTSTLFNTTLLSILIFLIFFAVAGSFNIIVITYV